MLAWNCLDPVLELWHRFANAEQKVPHVHLAHELKPAPEIGAQGLVVREKPQILREPLVFAIELDERLRVLNSRTDLPRAVQHAVRLHQTIHIAFRIRGDRVRIECAKAFAVRIPVLRDGGPAQARLENRARYHLEIIGEFRIVNLVRYRIGHA